MLINNLNLKKMKRLTILLIVLLATIISCQKEQNATNTPTKIGDYYTYKLDVSKDLVNTEDPDAEKIDKQLLVLSDVFIETLKNSEVREYIYSSAKLNDGFLSLNDFFTKFPHTKNDINLEIAANLYAKEFNIKSIDDINNNMMHMGTQMFPVINIPNIEKFQNNTTFISSAGIEVEDNEIDNIMDEVFAWLIKDNTKAEISVGEEIAKNNSIPLFIFTVHNNTEDYIDNTMNNFSQENYTNNSETETSNKTNWSSRCIQQRINYRYEGGLASSDYTVTGESYGRCNITSSIYSCTFDYYNSVGSNKYQNISTVKKKDVGKTLNNTYYDLLDSNNSHEFYFNTFERDWYATPKHLGSVTKESNTITLQGRMTYPNEWYGVSPNYLYTNNYQGSQVYGGSKGFINSVEW